MIKSKFEVLHKHHIMMFDIAKATCNNARANADLQEKTIGVNGLVNI